MKTFRTVLFWTHLAAGACAGIVILVMSFTGVVLALRPQIQNWVDRDIRSVAPHGTRLGARELLVRVQSASDGATPQSLALEADPAIAATVGMPGTGNVYVNPYTGEILGAPSAAVSGFFQSMVSWHRYMGATGESRATGKAATGASNLAFLLLGITGLYIWWPKRLTAQHLRPIVWFKRNATSRARDFNWHNSIGFWCLPAIIIMTMSGVVISYPWGTNLVYRLTGSPVPAARGGGPAGGGEGSPRAEGGTRRPGGAGTGEGSPGTESGARRPGGAGPSEGQAVIPETLDQLFASAVNQVPSWGQLSLRLPNREGGPVSFTITDGAQWNRFARSQLTLNAHTGTVVQWQPYEEQNAGQKVRGWLRFAHTGELGGLAGQIVAGIGCLGGVMLVYTGLALAYRRLLNWSFWSRIGVSKRSLSAKETARPAPSGLIADR